MSVQETKNTQHIIQFNVKGWYIINIEQIGHVGNRISGIDIGTIDIISG